MRRLALFLWSIASIHTATAANYLLSWDAIPLTNVNYQVWQSTAANPFILSVSTTNNSAVVSNIDTAVMTRWYVKYLFSGQYTSPPSETITNFPVVIPPAPSAGLTFEAESGALSPPFYATNGFIQQDVNSGVTEGGRASYPFTITNAGSYTVNILLNAPTDAANSFFLNIDAEPTDPAMIWDIPLTTGFQVRTAAWRGAGTFDANQFVPKSWTLSIGAHTLIIRGREPGVQLDQISVVQGAVTNTPPPPVLLPVSNLRAVRIASTRIDLQWQVAQPVAVQVERATGLSGTFKVVKNVNAGTVHWIDTSIKSNTDYVYKVCISSPRFCSNDLIYSAQ